MNLGPDSIVYSRWGAFALNATVVYTWIVMAILVLGSWLATRRLSTGTTITPLQNLLEVLVEGLRGQIREVGRQEPGRYLPFVGTLFVFIATCSLLQILPDEIRFVDGEGTTSFTIYVPPTGSLSTTAALATCVFIAVPIYGIGSRGVGPYLGQYVKPTPIMLPFNVIGEFSRTLALAVRLYGNMMSGTVVGAILLGFAPLFVPIVLDLLGLLTGMIQAYIFAILAMVYIASATRVQGDAAGRDDSEERNEGDEGDEPDRDVASDPGPRDAGKRERTA